MSNNYIFRDENLTDLIQYRDIEIEKCIEDLSISPAFFGNMMSLIFKKI